MCEDGGGGQCIDPGFWNEQKTERWEKAEVKKTGLRTDVRVWPPVQSYTQEPVVWLLISLSPHFNQDRRERR